MTRMPCAFCGKKTTCAADCPLPKIDPSSDMYVYFIHAPEVSVLKIGSTKNVVDRFHDIQTGSPVKLHLIGGFRGSRDDERTLHQLFKLERERGEWFTISTRLLATVTRYGAILATSEGVPRPTVDDLQRDAVNALPPPVAPTEQPSSRPPVASADRLMKPAELADYWSVTRAHIYNQMARGLPSLKIGTSRRIRLSEAEVWLEAQQ